MVWSGLVHEGWANQMVWSGLVWSGPIAKRNRLSFVMMLSQIARRVFQTLCRAKPEENCVFLIIFVSHSVTIFTWSGHYLMVPKWSDH